MTAVESPVAPAPDPQRAVARSWRPVVAVLAVAAVVLAGIVGFQLVRLDDRDDLVADRSAALAAATANVEALLTYDPASLENVQATIDSVTTGGFREEVSRLFLGTVKPHALEVKARTLAKVVGAGWVSAEPRRVVVLVFVNQSTSTERMVGDRIDAVQARVTMEQVDGRWLIAGLDRV